MYSSQCLCLTQLSRSNYQTDSRQDGGMGELRDKWSGVEMEILEREGLGGFVLGFSLKKHFDFTMPPAVALLNSGKAIHLRIFL